MPALSLHNLYRRFYALRRPKKFAALQAQRDNTTDTYTFKSLIDTQSVFVHIPKTAGISICTALYGNYAGGHSPLRAYQTLLSKEEYDRFFKFSVIRNPWSRVFSAFRFLKKGGMNEYDAKWSEENLSAFPDFPAFVKKGLHLKHIIGHLHFKPQTFYLKPRFGSLANNPLDFLALMENLDEDFDIIRQRVNPSASLPHLNQKSNDPNAYQEAYDPTLFNIVHQIYRADIEQFGYTFDNSSLETQLQRRPLPPSPSE